MLWCSVACCPPSES
uniref:Uncharacterized protein n=1 Tax=Arundo donax TaxID=35708 RepID=A0A0A9C3B7_ARUDO